MGCADGGPTQSPLYPSPLSAEEPPSHVIRRHADINTEKLKESMVMYEDAIDTLKKVATTTGTVPGCTLAQNHASKKVKESQAKENKCQTPHSSVAVTNHPGKEP